MLTIWGRENSTNVKKVLWCAAELDLAFNLIQAGGQYGKIKEPLFLSLNPNGLVPCMQDDENDLVLWESNTIVRYIAARFGQDTWLLADAATRAQSEKWMDWTLSSLAPALAPVFINLVRTPAKFRDSAAVATGIEACERLLDIAETALEKKSWFSGNDFGIGDIPMGCLAYNWFNLDIERKPRGRLQEWYDGISGRTAFKTRVMLPLS